MVGVCQVIPGVPFDVVYSHGDWDHVLGTSGLTEVPAEVISHERCADRFREELPRELKEWATTGSGDPTPPPLIPPTKTFEDHLDLDLGGVTLELRRLPGHTPDTIVGFVPQWNVLLAGDAVESPLPFLNQDSPIRRWIQELQGWARILSRNPSEALVIPSHGTAGGSELLTANALYLQGILAGRDPIFDRPLSPFYRETHANNRRLATPSSG
jgi:glyoxylase-like metal-dependent hydrolase (beta-lactamase superfamily II)